jgi:Family of unknown function (DUF6082)
MSNGPQKRSTRRIVRKVFIGTIFSLAGLIGLGMIVFSPLLLRELDRFTRTDWSRLSEIGQTYGAASAILAMLALGAVAASLLFQARQTKSANIQAIREFHLELTKMALDNPRLYLPSWGHPVRRQLKVSSEHFTRIRFSIISAWGSR